MVAVAVPLDDRAACICRRDDPHLKSVVIEAAQRMRRFEPCWRELSVSMAACCEPTSVNVGAVANRWLRGLFHQMKELPMAA